MTISDQQRQEIEAYLIEKAEQFRAKFPINQYTVGHAFVATGLDEIASAAETGEDIRDHYRMVIEAIQERITDIESMGNDTAH